MSDFTLVTNCQLENSNIENKKLYIGEWFFENRKKKFSEKIVKYKLESDNKLYNHKDYLEKLFEKILKEVTLKLNNYHLTEFDNRYWKIVVGPYVRFMIHVMHDRWSLIERAQKNYNIKETFLKDYIDESLPFLNTKELPDVATSNDDWNHMIFGKILNEFPSIEIKKVGEPINLRKIINKKNKNSLKKNKSIINKINSYFNFIKKNKIGKSSILLIEKILKIITQSYLKFIPSFLEKPLFPIIIIDDGVSFFKKYKIFLHNFNLPWNFTYISKTEVPIFSVDWPIREKILDDLSLEKFSSFECCTYKLIWTLMPTIFLEGFKNFRSKTKEKIYSFNVRNIIMKSHSVQNDFTNIFVAEKINSGTKLNILQWNAGPGIMKDHFAEIHDRDICDKYLTFGWSEKLDNKIYPLGILHNIPERNKNVGKKPENALLISYRLEKYSCVYETSRPRSTLWRDYLDGVFIFYKNLNEKIKNQTIIRPRPSVYDNKQQTMWKEKFNKVNYDNKSNFQYLFKKSKICINTYADSNTYLASLFLNIPTIIFWDEKLFKMRKSFEFDSIKLEKAGIFYRDPLSAALKLNTIWDNVDEWWRNKELQNIRQEFCEKHYKHNKDYLVFFKKLFKNEKI